MSRRRILAAGLAAILSTAGIAAGGDIKADGNVRAEGQLVSTVATGTPPLAVSSTTKVSKLNADRVDGMEASEFANAAATAAELASLQTQINNLAAKHSGAVYRWATFSTYHENLGWLMSDAPDLFGGVTPSDWTNGSAVAADLSSDKELLRTLFTRKGYGGKNATVVAEVYQQVSSTNGRAAAALFRIKNSTSGAINWSPHFCYTCFAGWSERASVALNGANSWNSGGENCGVDSETSVTLSIPGGRTSTVVFVSTGSVAYSSSFGETRALILAFSDNSLDLPTGLEFVDDLDTATGGWEQ